MKVAVIGPVYPYRAGIAYCTTALCEELQKEHDVTILSFSRQFPRRFYPGGSDIDETLRWRTPPSAQFTIDILNPLTWIATARKLRRERFDVVVVVWWIWVWAIPDLVMLALLRKETKLVFQCHNVGEKEPAFWKRWLSNLILRRAGQLVVHAASEAEEASRRVPSARVTRTFLPVHELGGDPIPQQEARKQLAICAEHVALFFGHVRPFKALDLVIRAWPLLKTNVQLLVAGEVWWGREEEYRKLAAGVGLTDPARVRFDFRFIPDAEIAAWFCAADVVLAPYRSEAQSGVALTAFHFARPVIASNVGGLPELIKPGENGFIVPPEDPRALADAIDRFFAGPSMQAGAAAAAACYSWAEYAAVIMGLVQR